MILVIASRHDSAAQALVESWKPRAEVLVMDCSDLCTAGWRIYAGRDRPSVAVAEGKPVAEDQIDGVLTLIPCVSEADLTQIVPSERGYVAAEMQAFLIYWLSRLRCPVLNRPSSMSVAGPNWRSEQWHHVAARIIMPVRPLVTPPTIPAERVPEAGDIVVTVVGKRIFGADSPILRRRAELLADTAGAALLEVHFSADDADAEFTGASPWPDFSDAEVGEAIFAELCERPTA
jgi:hypothetical protein